MTSITAPTSTIFDILNLYSGINTRGGPPNREPYRFYVCKLPEPGEESQTAVCKKCLPSTYRAINLVKSDSSIREYALDAYLPEYFDKMRLSFVSGYEVKISEKK